jgi:hippurate hydrolase
MKEPLIALMLLLPAVLIAAEGPRLPAAPGIPPLLAPLDGMTPKLDRLYLELHQAPELSSKEEKTAARMAALLRAEGFAVTEGVGGTGVVGLLRNGAGPVVMVRTDMDALPVKERTGLPYASAILDTDSSGRVVPVMHACGHDAHMAAWAGAASLLAQAKGSWRGTLMWVAQPSEETGSGANAMLADGLFTRFPKPDAAIAFHVHQTLPVGMVGYTPGYAMANVDSVDITFFGKGGHGAAPHQTVDPILLASRAVVALQAVVAREKDPLEPAVVTVGSFHAGTKHNIIPDEARIQLTVRSYKPEVRRQLLAAIERIARGEAAAAGAPKEPTIVFSEPLDAVYNDPALARRLAAGLEGAFGPGNVKEVPPLMAAEDFGAYGRAGVPAVLFLVGATDPKLFAEAAAKGEALPSIHSSFFAPARPATFVNGAKVLAVAAFDLLGRP